MKHYLDIENLRESSVDLGNGIKRPGNSGAFVPGDHICISEKIDGSNASIRLDTETGTVQAFSRKQELNPLKTLNGFYNFASGINPGVLKKDYMYFGEWTGARNKLVYSSETKGRWFLFDIFDAAANLWLPQDYVKKFAEENGFDYAHPLYDGPFISWKHCFSFMNSPFYGERQEGIVVKNQDKLMDAENREPAYLKIVNREFAESMIQVPRETDPEKEAEKQYARELAESIVTENRVAKMLTKLRDEGILGDEIGPEDMKTVARNIPKRIYEDCLKEEKEAVFAMGEYAGKSISSIAMMHAKKIILG